MFDGTILYTSQAFIFLASVKHS